jgi:hypothetical protein
VKRYEVLNISDHDDKSSIVAMCTDHETLQFIKAKVKELRPKSKVKFERKDAGGVVYMVAIEKCGFDYKRDEVTSWLVRYFCHQGWKPTKRGLILEVEIDE